MAYNSATPSLPNRRVLLACSDVAVRDPLAAALRTAGVEVYEAENTKKALALFARQSFPVVIADRQLDSGDGLELVQTVRAFSIEPVYVILMTSDSSGVQMERGYCAGVDQHMPRDSEARAAIDRVQAAFKAIALRRAGRRLAFGHDVVTVDLASGAHTARHLVGRLSAEIKLAQHAGRPLDIVILRVHAPASEGGTSSEDQLANVLDAVQRAVRPNYDWVACLHSVGQNHRLAIVLPDCPPGSVEALEQHVRNAFALNEAGTHAAPKLSFGHVSFQATDSELPTALDLLAQADPNRRAAGKAGPATAANAA